MTNNDLTKVLFPNGKDAVSSTQPHRQLSAFLPHIGQIVRIELIDSTQHRVPIQLPRFALSLFNEALRELAAGNAVVISPIYAELTTHQAANILGVSRSHLVKLLTEGSIPHTQKGRDRCIRLADLIAYQTQLDGASQVVMNELTAQAQDLGMGYDQ